MKFYLKFDLFSFNFLLFSQSNREIKLVKNQKKIETEVSIKTDKN